MCHIFFWKILEMQGATIPIELTEEMLMLLLRGGTVNYIIEGVQIRLLQKTPLVVIDKLDYRNLKRTIGRPEIQELIFKKIDK